MDDFSDRLRQQRRIRKLSQEKLANLAGVSQPYIAELERGVKKPSVEVLLKLCDVLGCSADYLLGTSVSKSSAFVQQRLNEGGLTLEMLQEVAKRNITPAEFQRALRVASLLHEEEIRPEQ